MARRACLASMFRIVQHAAEMVPKSEKIGAAQLTPVPQPTTRRRRQRGSSYVGAPWPSSRASSFTATTDPSCPEACRGGPSGVSRGCFVGCQSSSVLQKGEVELMKNSGQNNTVHATSSYLPATALHHPLFSGHISVSFTYKLCHNHENIRSAVPSLTYTDH